MKHLLHLTKTQFRCILRYLICNVHLPLNNDRREFIIVYCTQETVFIFDDWLTVFVSCSAIRVFSIWPIALMAGSNWARNYCCNSHYTWSIYILTAGGSAAPCFYAKPGVVVGSMHMPFNSIAKYTLLSVYLWGTNMHHLFFFFEFIDIHL